MTPDLPSTPYDLAAAYLDLVDAEAPGPVVGPYLTGSVALGDFRPHRSDVDFVAVTATLAVRATARRSAAGGSCWRTSRW